MINVHLCNPFSSLWWIILFMVNLPISDEFSSSRWIVIFLLDCHLDDKILLVINLYLLSMNLNLIFIPSLAFHLDHEILPWWGNVIWIVKFILGMNFHFDYVLFYLGDEISSKKSIFIWLSMFLMWIILVLIEFYLHEQCSSLRWIFILMMNFQFQWKSSIARMFGLIIIKDGWIFILMMNFHLNNEFSSKLWIFI